MPRPAASAMIASIAPQSRAPGTCSTVDQLKSVRSMPTFAWPIRAMSAAPSGVCDYMPQDGCAEAAPAESASPRSAGAAQAAHRMRGPRCLRRLGSAMRCMAGQGIQRVRFAPAAVGSVGVKVLDERVPSLEPDHENLPQGCNGGRSIERGRGAARARRCGREAEEGAEAAAGDLPGHEHFSCRSDPIPIHPGQNTNLWGITKTCPNATKISGPGDTSVFAPGSTAKGYVTRFKPSMVEVLPDGSLVEPPSVWDLHLHHVVWLAPDLGGPAFAAGEEKTHRQGCRRATASRSAATTPGASTT